MLLWMTMKMLFGFHGERIEQHAIVTNFVAIPAIIIHVFAMKQKKKDFYKGQMSYMQGFIFTITLSLIIAILSPLSLYISTTLISPDYYSNAVSYNVERGFKKQAHADAYFNLRDFMIEGSIGLFLMGIVTGALMAILLRTKKGLVLLYQPY
jgi:hypothetical protein